MSTPRIKSRKEILLIQQLNACDTLILAYQHYTRTYPHMFQPHNTYYQALLEEHKKIQEQIIDEQIRFFVYGDDDS